MKTIALDTSVINYLYDQKIEVISFNKLLLENNFIPFIGMYTHYEIFRLCMDKNKIKKTSSLFKILDDIKPVYGCPRNLLYKREAEKFRSGKHVDNLAFQEQLAEIKEILHRIDRGIFDEEDRRSINDRQNGLSKIIKIIWQPTQDDKKSRWKNKPFNAFCNKQMSNLDLVKLNKILSDYLNINFSLNELNQFIKNINSYPAFRTLLYSQFYITYSIIQGSGNNQPSEDRLTDSLQLIEASYCTAFLSNDKRHLKYAKEINNNLEYFTLEGLSNDILLCKK